MESLVIAAEVERDAAAVDAVLRLAFAAQPGVADMVAAVRSSAGAEPALTLVGRHGTGIVGFVMLSHVDLVAADGARHDALTLSPLAVLPALQRRGIGSALVRTVLALAAERRDLPRVVTLEGDATYYARFGFASAPDVGITIDLPGWAPPTAAQAILLPGAGTVVRGRVAYPPAFLLAQH